MSPITTHILDTHRGVPADGVGHLLLHLELDARVDGHVNLHGVPLRLVIKCAVSLFPDEDVVLVGRVDGEVDGRRGEVAADAELVRRD